VPHQMQLLSDRRRRRHSRLGHFGLLLLASALLLGALTTPSQAGSLGTVPYYHGFSAPNQGSCWAPQPADSMGDNISGQIGSNTLRLQCYWSEYETGPNEYSSAFLEGLLSRVRTAQANSSNSNVRLLVNLDLPGSEKFEWPASVTWMNLAGYGMQSATHETNIYRWYPTSAKGLEAYGRAMAKILKYLHSRGVSAFIETPNEPNISGPSDQVPAERIGQMAGQAVSFAAAEGLQLNSERGPAILAGAILIGTLNPQSPDYKKHQENLVRTDWSTGKFVKGNDAEYFWEVQHMADYTIEQWWKSIPGGPSFATTLIGTWRPSFHAYPELGETEEHPCMKENDNLQDHKGNRTATEALGTVEAKLSSVMGVISNNKRWWLTETGMTSYKTDPNLHTESPAQCKSRRETGGNTYGRTQQSEFFKKFASTFKGKVEGSTAHWNRFEGVTFFLPQDFNIGDTFDAYPGYGVHWPGSASNCNKLYPCRKQAAETFNSYYSDAESLPPSGWTKENIGPGSNCGGSGQAEPAITSWGQGRLDLFVCGSNSHLWHRWWDSNVGWSAWEDMGGVLTSPPSAVSWEPNRIDVVARAQYGEIYHWAWNGSSWSNENIQGVSKGAPSVSSRGKAMLDVFVRGTDDALWIKSLYPGTGWTGWNKVGGGLSAAPSSVSWGSNRIDVIVRGTYNDYWHAWWAGSSWNWENLGGSFTSPPAVSSRGVNALDVYGRGTYGDLWHRTLIPGVGWAAWENMGGYMTSGPSAVSWGSERIDIVNSSTDYSIAHWAWGK
jgi:hypothetical protein